MGNDTSNEGDICVTAEVLADDGDDSDNGGFGVEAGGVGVDGFMASGVRIGGGESWVYVKGVDGL